MLGKKRKTIKLKKLPETAVAVDSYTEGIWDVDVYLAESPFVTGGVYTIEHQKMQGTRFSQIYTDQGLNSLFAEVGNEAAANR